MSKRQLPILTPAEVVTKLVALGFEEVRQKGSHKQFRHADGRCTTVPFHKGRDISPILLRQIARDIRVTAEEIVDALRGAVSAAAWSGLIARYRQPVLSDGTKAPRVGFVTTAVLSTKKRVSAKKRLKKRLTFQSTGGRTGSR